MQKAAGQPVTPPRWWRDDGDGKLYLSTEPPPEPEPDPVVDELMRALVKNFPCVAVTFTPADALATAPPIVPVRYLDLSEQEARAAAARAALLPPP